MSSTKRTTGRPLLTWAEVVLRALRSTGQPMPLSDLYSEVKKRAPKLVAHNHHWQPKVRQVVQRLRDRGLAKNPSAGIWKATRPKSGDKTA